MTAAGWRGGSADDRGALSIGAVLDGLRAEFPEVTISKIRFLESEGLVHPARTASGYRQFSQGDVERLRFVLAAQRDHYLPLKVIKSQLDEWDRDGAPAARRPPRPMVSVPGEGLPGPDELVVGGPGRRLTREQLLAEADIGPEVLDDLEQYGIVRPGRAGFYDGDVVMLARAAAALTGFGIEPRHLRAFRAAADREVGLLAQVVGPVARQRDPDARSRAEELAREVAALSVRLHALLVKAGVREVLAQ